MLRQFIFIIIAHVIINIAAGVVIGVVILLVVLLVLQGRVGVLLRGWQLLLCELPTGSGAIRVVVQQTVHVEVLVRVVLGRIDVGDLLLRVAARVYQVRQLMLKLGIEIIYL
jgi:hypothetical protein